MVSRRLIGTLFGAAFVVAACTGQSADRSSLSTLAPLLTTTSAATTTSTSTTSTSTTTTTAVPLFSATGSVTNAQGVALSGVTIEAGGVQTTSFSDGSFILEDAPHGVVVASRPAWLTTQLVWEGDLTLSIVMEPRIVRAIRVSRAVAADPAAFERILVIADTTTVNALVFDTKDESGYLLYNSGVAKASEIGSNRDVYDPVAYIRRAKERDLYTITRIVTFEDAVWAKGDPSAVGAGSWINATDESTWEYPLALAVEACELGFDEIQFDYVRFPSGRTATRLRQTMPTTQDLRVTTIESFLAEAQALLHAGGCAVSADIFGIVMTSPSDEGIGQRPEELSAVTDALSPMLYPSHFGPGWLGFDDPNDFPGPVVAHSLDLGIPRLTGAAVVRPWLQGFYYNAAQVRIQIEETESRGLGWIVWNANGNYDTDWFPTDAE